MCNFRGRSVLGKYRGKDKTSGKHKKYLKPKLTLSFRQFLKRFKKKQGRNL